MSDSKGDLTNWVRKQLGLEIINIETIVDTPWSTVLKIVTKDDIVFLKQTPPDLSIEADIFQMIQNNIVHPHIPKVLFRNPDLHSFIMESCGNYSLRKKFNGTLDSDLLFKGLESYIKIQRAFEQNVHALEAVGMPDWRMKQFPALYLKLLDEKEMLLNDGLTTQEYDKLVELAPAVKSICDSISKYPILETLVNVDFNENNLILNEKTQEISVIDMGESVISHPFLSIAAHLSNNARRYKLDLNGKILQSIRDKWLDCWSDVADIEDLKQAYEDVYRIMPILGALGSYRLQVATENKSCEMPSFWSITSSLKVLIENEK